MVPLKDILNQEKSPDEERESKTSGLTEHSISEKQSNSDSHQDFGADASIHSSCYECTHADRHVETSENLPSPPFSMSSSGSCLGNSDNEKDSNGNEYEEESNSSKCGPTGSSSHISSPRSDFASSNEEEFLVCEWDNCGKAFSQPELLYHHLCSDHVGRKSQKNLELNCKWKNCNAKTEKRDHITSHLRVHVPLKPFKCSSCQKNFKRPQDLKKHLKIHAESHISVKKKRGPRAGSKRINKKAVIKDSMTNVNDTSMNGRGLSIDSDTSLPSPIGSSILPNIPQSLPPISMHQLISHELSSYEPIYTKQLGARLQTILPPLSNDDHLPRTTPMSTTNAASFFSTLSKNMTNSLAGSQHSYSQPPVISQPIRTVAINGHIKSPILNNMHLTPNPKPIQFGSPTLQRSKYPEFHQLPPIGSSHFTQDGYSRLPSLPAVPVLTPRYSTFDRVPQFNTYGQNFSSSQRSTGKKDSEDVDTTQSIAQDLLSLRLADKNEDNEEDLVEFLDVLQTVNILKDYYMCLLLEEEYESEDESDHGPGELKTDVIRKDRPVVKLPKYPKLAV